MILLTGSRGLIGRAVLDRLRAHQIAVREFDVRRSVAEDTRNADSLRLALDGVSGIIHLAAVSRVVWAQRDPALTEAVNVEPINTIADHIRTSALKPWLIFGSSREVYGDSEVFPVSESAELKPLNVYARSKVAGECVVAKLAVDGFTAYISRFSNVYGSVDDHEDRVVPAFARAASQRSQICVEGAESLFDFTHVDDVSRAIHMQVERAILGEQLDPIHFVTGRPCSLGELAEMARARALGNLTIIQAPPRNFDVARFYGDPARAQELLGWTAGVSIEEGLTRLIRDFGAEAKRNEASSTEHDLSIVG